MRNKIGLIGLLIMFILTIKCWGNEQIRIPADVEKMKFEVVHSILDKGQQEYYLYEIFKDQTTLCLFAFEKSKNRQVKFEKAFKGRRFRKYPQLSNLYLIEIMNMIDIMNISNRIPDSSAKSGSVDTTTEFRLSYQYKGKLFRKKIVIENLDEQVENNVNPEAFKLKFMMLKIDSIKHYIYTRDY